MRIPREAKIKAKEALKAHLDTFPMDKLKGDVRDGAKHILAQIDKWYLSYQPVAAAERPKKATTKKRAGRKKKVVRE